MPDVATWLQELGLAKYARAFEENEIDFAALPYLSENMLQQIGLPVGPRAKLLAAISKLVASSSIADRDGESKKPPTAQLQIAPQRDAERRQVTVMFCDLVDSTKLATRLDPEELRSVLEAYQTTCAAIVERYEGHVAQYSGDGILAYFGWPRAQEDAAERAVRAGLEVVKALKAVDQGPEPLAVRAGISTGIVVIGKTGLGDPSTPPDAFGETVHLAARLQAFAPPNSVVIAESTSRLVSARFDQEELGPQDLKGMGKPVHVFLVRGTREDTSRFEAAHPQAMTPLVDRVTEVAWLQQRWRVAAEGEGQVVFVSGAPGIGKSRLVHELERLIANEAHFTLGFQCLPHCMQSALVPVIQQIQKLANLTSDDPADAKLDKIKKLLSLAVKDVDRAAPLIAEMMSIPIDSRYAPRALTAEQMKAQILSVLVELLLGLARKGPVFCLLEDAQWIDPSTQELLDLVIGQIEKARVLIIVTHRPPEYQVNTGFAANVSALTISRLGHREVAEMAALLLRDRAVSTAVMKRVIEDSDSIPLFVEELARGLTEKRDAAGLHADNGEVAPLASWLVPDSLRDSLAARLDKAPQARSVAQIAAVIGREFSYDALLHVSSLPVAELDSALRHLRESGIVHLIDSRPPARYAFKHALLRDAAYESLLKSNRRAIHAKVASLIERESPEIVTAQPELLAYHYNMAGNAEYAMQYWLQGGRRARTRSANVEAAVQFQRALELLEMLPEAPERKALELEIQLSLGLCFIALHGYSADATRKSFERARSLSISVGEVRKEIQAIFGLWGHYWMRARHDQAIELSEILLVKAEHLNDQIARAVGYRSLGSTFFTLGDFIRAREYLERAVNVPRANADVSSLSLSYAADPHIAAQLILGWDLWILGYPAQAHHHMLEALAEAKHANPYTLAFAHYMTCAVQLFRGEFQDAVSHANRSLAISNEHRIDLYKLYSRFARGCALVKLGEQQRGIADAQRGIEEARRINLGHMRGFMLGWFATIQLEAGDPEAALSTIDDALKQINDITGRAWEAELRRLRGDVLIGLRPDDTGEAEQSYDNAISIAQNQSAHSFELRATVSLAKLLHQQNRSNEAYRRLAAALGWFTEGFETQDLRSAQALLATFG